MDVLADIAAQLYEGKGEEVARLTGEALRAGLPPKEVLTGGLLAGMANVGRDFKAGQRFIPEVLVSARAMHMGMAVLEPHLAKGESTAAGRFVIGTVQGDIHDIGKNLVGMMMRGAGFEVIDLGVDVPPAKFVQAIRDHHPQVLGISALLSTTMLEMGKVIAAINEAGLRGEAAILVGGAPVTEEFARQVGADGFAPEAGSAVEKAQELSRGRSRS
ncbi:MAG TPA: corrinoid protein [Anaerolineales bacterium]|nr:corrinoid protein [Anaerolineales bacterium]